MFWSFLIHVRYITPSFGTQYNWQLAGFSRMECDPLFAKSVFAWIQWNIEWHGTIWNPKWANKCWCLSNSRQKRHEFGKMSRAQVIVPIFLDQFYHSDLVNVAWSGLGVSPGFPARTWGFWLTCQPLSGGSTAEKWVQSRMIHPWKQMYISFW